MNTTTPMTKAAQESARIEANRKAAYTKKVRTLLGHLVGERLSDTGLLTSYTAGITADEAAADIASREPVGAAIHPMKATVVQFAEERAKDRIAKVRADLEAHGWDLNKAAPYPQHGRPDVNGDYAPGVFRDSWDRKDAQRRMKDKHSFYGQLVTTDKAAGHHSGRRGEPHIVVMSSGGMERFVNQAREAAAQQYDSFICKMVSKVGDVTAAEIEGNHIWGHSHLTVTLRDGTTQIWRTQQIVNFSSLGNAYYQWPSRVVKAKN